jgi:DNA replication protein
MPTTRGFSRDTRYTPVPSPLLGPLLQEIKSTSELRCTLRVLGLVHQRRSRRLWVTFSELIADSVLVNALAKESEGTPEAIRTGVEEAVARGTLLQAQQPEASGSETLLFVNDEPGRRAYASIGQDVTAQETHDLPENIAPEAARPTIYALYEENIGTLTPLLAEEMKEAEVTYQWTWIEDAFREAVNNNRRNWRYIARILENWATEGKRDGKPGRHTETTDPKEYLRRYGHLAR